MLATSFSSKEIQKRQSFFAVPFLSRTSRLTLER
jgi:hypothetical protein